jgi:hypothetical protein
MPIDYLYFLVLIILFNALPDYISLLESRIVLNWMKRVNGVVIGILLLLDATITTLIAIFVTIMTASLFNPFSGVTGTFGSLFPDIAISTRTGLLLLVTTPMKPLISDVFVGGWAASYLIPAFFTSIWLWLYAGSGFILKAARRFDVGFQLFNRTFDIEQKPLSAIGLIAGALVAVIWWTFVIVRRLVG